MNWAQARCSRSVSSGLREFYPPTTALGATGVAPVAKGDARRQSVPSRGAVTRGVPQDAWAPELGKDPRRARRATRTEGVRGCRRRARMCVKHRPPACVRERGTACLACVEVPFGPTPQGGVVPQVIHLGLSGGPRGVSLTWQRHEQIYPT